MILFMSDCRVVLDIMYFKKTCKLIWRTIDTHPNKTEIRLNFSFFRSAGTTKYTFLFRKIMGEFVKHYTLLHNLGKPRWCYGFVGFWQVDLRHFSKIKACLWMVFTATAQTDCFQFRDDGKSKEIHQDLRKGTVDLL